MLISLIFTVKDEAASLPRLLDSIAAQTRAPDEIVVVDGGSRDATPDILRDAARRLPLRIISEPGANISQGRNAAIRAARGDIICATDAGVRLDANWVAELVRPFEEKANADERGKLQSESISHPRESASTRVPNISADVVAGFFLADPHSVFETALAATTLPTLAEIQPEKFLPSSRSIAFRKSAWADVGGYPEWLDYCEDLIFDFKLRALHRIAFAPRARVHFRPRENLRAFCRQYYQYARGDGKANLWRARHLIRYTTYLVVLPLTLGLIVVSPLFGLGILTVGFAAMFFAPFNRLIPMARGLTLVEKIRAGAWMPVIRVAGDIAKMCGYPVGVLWRARHRGVDRRIALN